MEPVRDVWGAVGVGDVVMVAGKEYTVKKVRGRFVTFEDGTEMQFLYRVADVVCREQS